VNKYICDDRQDMDALSKKIDAMTDEEFERHIEKLKEKEHLDAGKMTYEEEYDKLNKEGEK